MSAMERSLRRALDAGDATDPAFREAIYTASERALERMLEEKATEAAAAHAQRVRLAETINRVEDDYYARQVEAGEAEEGPAQHDPLLSLDPAYADAHAYGTGDHGEPAVDGPSDRAEDLDPVAGLAPQGLAQPPDPRWEAEAFPARPEVAVAPRRRRPLLVMVIGALVILAILAFLLSAFDGSGQGASAAAVEEPWIPVFAGTELQSVAASGGARVAAVAAADGAPALRLTGGGAEGTLALDVGPGLVRHLAGRRIEVELTAGRAVPGAAADFGVRCLFGGETVCGRQHLAASEPSQVFVFEMDLPRSVGEGAIAIDPAPAGDIDIYSLRLRPVGRA